jgi:hypothetical protein
MAYNAAFDMNGLNKTQRYITKSAYRWFFPYGVKVECIWHMACQTICSQKKYFDYSTACDSLSLFDHIDILKIEKAYIPEHVTEVKFSADLSHLTDARDKGYGREDSTLFHALY